MDQLGRDPRRRFSIYTAVVVDVVARTSAPCAAASDAAKPMEGWLAMGCAVAKDSDVSDCEGPVAKVSDAFDRGGWLAMGAAVAKDSDVSDREGPVAALAAGRQTPPL